MWVPAAPASSSRRFASAIRGALLGGGATLAGYAVYRIVKGDDDENR